jgi:hypothetical protein
VLTNVKLDFKMNELAYSLVCPVSHEGKTFFLNLGCRSEESNHDDGNDDSSDDDGFSDDDQVTSVKTVHLQSFYPFAMNRTTD